MPQQPRLVDPLPLARVASAGPRRAPSRSVSIPDHELLERWRSGDQLAGHTLFIRHCPSIVRFFENKVASDHEDLVQATFMACVSSRDRIQDAARFRGYLFGIAHRTLQEHYRRRFRGVDVSQRSVSTMCDPSPSPVSIRARGQAAETIGAALRQIPLEMQTVLELYYWEELTAAQIAQTLEVAEGTVRSRIRRGLERLAQVLSRDASPFRVEAQLRRWAESLRVGAPE